MNCTGGDGDDVLVSIDGAATDRLFGEDGLDSFWGDNEGSTDDVLDAVAFEQAHNFHAVATFANGADKSLNGDDIADPTDGQFYQRFSGRPLFSSKGPSQADIRQGGLGDCWLMSGLGAAAKANPNSIRQTVAELGDGTYVVELGTSYYRLDADLPTLAGTLVYAGLGQEGSIWVPVVEKAYAFFRTGAGTYASLNGGSSGTVFEAIGGSGFVSTGPMSAEAALAHIAAELEGGKAVVVNILTPSLGAPLIGRHAYMVERVNDQPGTTIAESVVLRNPWGRDGAGGDGLDDGLVTVTGAQLVASMFNDGGIQSAWVA